MLPYLEAICSSALLNLSLVFQAIDARKAPSALAMRPGLLFHLMRRWLWMTGNAMNVASAVLQVLALERLPVAVVQSISAGGILLVPLSARWLLKERPRLGDWVALGAIVGGLALAMASTPPQEARLTLSIWTVFGATLALSAVGAVTALRFKRTGTLIAAGTCFGAATVISKVLALPETSGLRTLAAIALLVCAGGTGFLAQTTALQTMSPARVGPVVLASSTALPIFAAPALFDEHWPKPHYTILATLVVIVAAAYLASQPLAPPSVAPQAGLAVADGSSP
jgi:drug/metabolite transporter (DMT)-like permease